MPCLPSAAFVFLGTGFTRPLRARRRALLFRRASSACSQAKVLSASGDSRSASTARLLNVIRRSALRAACQKCRSLGCPLSPHRFVICRVEAQCGAAHAPWQNTHSSGMFPTAGYDSAARLSGGFEAAMTISRRTLLHPDRDWLTTEQAAEILCVEPKSVIRVANSARHVTRTEKATARGTGYLWWRPDLEAMARIRRSARISMTSASRVLAAVLSGDLEFSSALRGPVEVRRGA